MSATLCWRSWRANGKLIQEYAMTGKLIRFGLLIDQK
jgi:hypothetical protein